MNCPYCASGEVKVVDKRNPDDKTIRRRRECIGCGKRFTTYERIEPVDLVVVKKDDRRERFDRNKLKRGLLKACEKRQISNEEIDRITDAVEADLRNGDEVEISSRKIGEIVMRLLKRTDMVAYIRFASVYREFKDVEGFREEIKRLDKRGSG